MSDKTDQTIRERMTTLVDAQAQKRLTEYIVFSVILCLGYILLRDSGWQGSTKERIRLSKNVSHSYKYIF